MNAVPEPEQHYYQDHCAVLLQSRIQAVVDQLVGVVATADIWQTMVAQAGLAAHIGKCAAAAQKALDAYAQEHGEVPAQVMIDSTIEFLKLLS